jgi:hypothetical protein
VRKVGLSSVESVMGGCSPLRSVTVIVASADADTGRDGRHTGCNAPLVYRILQLLRSGGSLGYVLTDLHGPH